VTYFGFFDQAEGLQAEIKRLNDRISTELNKIVNLLLNTHRKLLDEIILALPAIRAEEEEEAEEDADETAQVVAPANARVEALSILMDAAQSSSSMTGLNFGIMVPKW
jgi:CO dehydrogenase/acetyl-CoA synthase beta subunit